MSLFQNVGNEEKLADAALIAAKAVDRLVDLIAKAFQLYGREREPDTEKALKK